MVHERHNALKPARSAQQQRRTTSVPSDITSSAHIGDTAGSTATPVLNVPAEQPYRPTEWRRQARVPTSNRLSARNLLATPPERHANIRTKPSGPASTRGCLHDIGTHRASVQHSDRLDRLRAREVIHGHHCAESKKYEQRAAPRQHRSTATTQRTARAMCDTYTTVPLDDDAGLRDARLTACLGRQRLDSRA
ncbi:hypothetical protein BJ912DRAFT_671940 [Pholiota molesta]|nr:hypothetical protein BJ912DRAFT_671940 [Pholiota molesta]